MPNPEENATLDLVAEQLKSQGVSSVGVKDGRLWFFSRAMVEELYRKLQENPTATQLHLMIYSDSAKLKTASIDKRN